MFKNIKKEDLLKTNDRDASKATVSSWQNLANINGARKRAV